MSIKKASLNEILITLKEWNLESKNPRNDGWVQAGYKEKIKKVFNETGKLLRENK
jgi:hypothetical protein